MDMADNLVDALERYCKYTGLSIRYAYRPRGNLFIPVDSDISIDLLDMFFMRARSNGSKYDRELAEMVIGDYMRDRLSL